MLWIIDTVVGHYSEIEQCVVDHARPNIISHGNNKTGNIGRVSPNARPYTQGVVMTFHSQGGEVDEGRIQ
jgi:hypothetical protein